METMVEKVRCTVCGSREPKRRMIQRRLNERTVYCCSLSCEVRWEKANLFGVCG